MLVNAQAVEYAKERLNDICCSAQEHPEYKKSFAAYAEVIKGLKGRIEHVEILELEEAFLNDAKVIAEVAYIKGLQDGGRLAQISK